MLPLYFTFTFCFTFAFTFALILPLLRRRKKIFEELTD